MSISRQEEIDAWEKTAAENAIVLRHVDLTSHEDMAELYQILAVKGVAARSRLRGHILQSAAAHPPAVYLVGVKIRQAKQSNGARGNVYKLLEQHNGRFSQAEGVRVGYENDDLVATAYFMNDDSASAFQTAINSWEIHKELVHLEGIELDPITPKAVPAPSDLQRIRLQDYRPLDF